jgi:hypothetical protein
MIVEDQFLQDQFKQALSKSKTERKSLPQTEREVLGYDHTQIGMAVAENWHFPEELGLTIGYHHDPDGIQRTYRRLASVLHVADYLCQDNAIGYLDRPFLDETVFRRCIRELKVESHALDLIFEDLRQEINKMEDQGLL